MAQALKVGSRVAFRTSRGTEGSGKIVGIRVTGRGDWIEIEVPGRVKPVCVRIGGVWRA